jgi:hypothetical protein
VSQSAAVAPTPQRWSDLGLLSFHVKRELSEISKMPTGVLVRLLYGKFGFPSTYRAISYFTVGREHLFIGGCADRKYLPTLSVSLSLQRVSIFEKLKSRKMSDTPYFFGRNRGTVSQCYHVGFDGGTDQPR